MNTKDEKNIKQVHSLKAYLKNVEHFGHLGK
jgi:hypothetical protein